MAKTKSERMRSAALMALMDSNTVSEAAAKAGISRRTMYDYLHHDLDFAQRYEEALKSQTIAFLESLTERRNHALDVITALLDDEKQPPAIRLKAAQTILNATAEQASIVKLIVQSEAFRLRTANIK